MQIKEAALATTKLNQESAAMRTTCSRFVLAE
jgi:hypothetical protein